MCRQDVVGEFENLKIWKFRNGVCAGKTSCGYLEMDVCADKTWCGEFGNLKIWKWSLCRQDVVEIWKWINVPAEVVWDFEIWESTQGPKNVGTCIQICRSQFTSVPKTRVRQPDPSAPRASLRARAHPIFHKMQWRAYSNRAHSIRCVVRRRPHPA